MLTRICLFAAVLFAVNAASAQNAPAPGKAADEAFMQSMQSMQQSMTGPMKGNADQDFVGMMIPHHQGAIDMAKVELQYGKDPMLRRMANKIIKDQQKEIAQMKKWQSKH